MKIPRPLGYKTSPFTKGGGSRFTLRSSHSPAPPALGRTNKSIKQFMKKQTVNEAGRKGGLQKGINAQKTRKELATRLSQLVSHQRELIEMLQTRPNSWLRAKIEEFENKYV